jgi:hypothetical protein
MVAAGCGIDGKDILAICEKACLGRVDGFTASSSPTGIKLECRCVTEHVPVLPPGAPEKTKEGAK